MDSATTAGLTRYASAHCFRPSNRWRIGNAWHRPLEVTDLDGSAPPLDGPAAASTPRGLAIHRALYAVYEQAMTFLPHLRINPICQRDFDAFYDRDLAALGRRLEPELEKAAFAWLDADLAAAADRPRTKAELVDWLEAQVREADAARLPVADAILAARRRDLALEIYLLAKAPDFLTEGSAMAWNLAGSYGPVQTALAAIFHDEYGGGDLARKHSTLFRNQLASCGLEAYPHAHYDAYLPSALMMASYFHYLCRHPTLLFPYLGAAFFAEATTPAYNARLLVAVRATSPRIDVGHLEVHAVMDHDHRRIVRDQAIAAAVDAYGEGITPAIAAGVSSFRRVATEASRAIVRQIALAESVAKRAVPAATPPDVARSRPFSARVAAAPTVLVAGRGGLELGFGAGNPWWLEPGTEITVPAGCLYRTFGEGDAS